MSTTIWVLDDDGDDVTEPAVIVESGDEGPAGQPAAQDIGWGELKGGFAPGEVINAGPAGHAATLSNIVAHTNSGVTVEQTLPIAQVRAGVTIATGNLTLQPGQHDVVQALASPFMQMQGDIYALTLPNPVDASLEDLNATLVSSP